MQEGEYGIQAVKNLKRELEDKQHYCCDYFEVFFAVKEINDDTFADGARLFQPYENIDSEKIESEEYIQEIEEYWLKVSEREMSQKDELAEPAEIKTVNMLDFFNGMKNGGYSPC